MCKSESEGQHPNFQLSVTNINVKKQEGGDEGVQYSWLFNKKQSDNVLAKGQRVAG
jgi:hypothetical protein